MNKNLLQLILILGFAARTFCLVTNHCQRLRLKSLARLSAIDQDTVANVATVLLAGDQNAMFSLSISTYIENAQTALLQTLLPVDAEDFQAVFVAEGISGFLGGVASKFVSNINGNKNDKNRGFVEAGTSTGAYFGIVAATRSFLRVLGASPILLNVIAFSFATSAASVFKYRQQLILPQRKRVGSGPTMYELMKFKEPSMMDMMKFAKDENCQFKPRKPVAGTVCRVEVAADFMKWFCYYSLLLPAAATTSAAETTFTTTTTTSTSVATAAIATTMHSEVALASSDIDDSIAAILATAPLRVAGAALLGAFIGAVAQIVREKDDKRLAEELVVRSAEAAAISPEAERAEAPVVRYLRAASEGAAQLAVYEAAKSYVISISPYFEHLDTLALQ